MTLAFEILTSSQFDSMMKSTSECIKNAYQQGLEMYNAPTMSLIQRPKSQTIVSTDARIDALIQLHLQQSIQLNSDRSKAGVTLSPADCARFPSKIQISQLSSLTKQQLESWAAGTIKAYLRGNRAFQQSIELVTSTDTYPMDNIALTRCSRLVRLQRKWENIPPIDAQNGKVKQKTVSVMNKNSKAQYTKERELQLLADYRTILKNVLRDFNIQFEKQFGKEPSKEDKELLRPLYMEYKALKQFVNDDFDQKQVQIDDPQLKTLVNTLVSTKGSATTMLQKMVPRDQAGIRLFKKEVQKCLFGYKDAYDKCLNAVGQYKKQTGKLPVGFQENWAQGFIEVYNLLFSAYEKLKAQVK
ncbi:Conserved_hypothetical protein [Hexamita inflata]|uniref:FAM13A-like domain-containing protein n=1 Tax=Hexamita inflata TaxID=28002 RepID=A0AA86P1X0_9EUKA|nr:Conserved hypothetical protein [Hexamita inflata]